MGKGDFVGILDEQGQGVDAHGGRSAGDGAGVTVESEAGGEVGNGPEGIAQGAIATTGGRQGEGGDGDVHGVDLRRHGGQAETRRGRIAQGGHHGGDVIGGTATVAGDGMADDDGDEAVVVVAAGGDGDRVRPVPVGRRDEQGGKGINEGVGHEGQGDAVPCVVCEDVVIGHAGAGEIRFDSGAVAGLDDGRRGGDRDDVDRPGAQPDAVGDGVVLGHVQLGGGHDDVGLARCGGELIARLLADDVVGGFGDAGEPVVGEGQSRRGLGGDAEGVAETLARRDGGLATGPAVDAAGDGPGRGDVQRGRLRKEETRQAVAPLLHDHGQRQRAGLVAVQEEGGQGGQAGEQAFGQGGEPVVEEAQDGQGTQVGEEGAGQHGQVIDAQVEVRQGTQAGEEAGRQGAQPVDAQVEVDQGMQAGEDVGRQGAQLVGAQVEVRQGTQAGEDVGRQGAQLVGTQVEVRQGTQAGEDVGRQGAQTVGAQVEAGQRMEAVQVVVPE